MWCKTDHLTPTARPTHRSTRCPTHWTPLTHSRIIELRREHADYISAKRSEAADAVLLMGRSVSAKAASERERDGLVILSAQYGLASAFTPRGIRAAREDGVDDVVDVTIPVQGLVQNSRLFIPAGRNKFNLLGFYDPCIGENKRLRVRYLFRGKVHEVTVDDVSMLRAPVKCECQFGEECGMGGTTWVLTASARARRVGARRRTRSRGGGSSQMSNAQLLPACIA